MEWNTDIFPWFWPSLITTALLYAKTIHFLSFQLSFQPVKYSVWPDKKKYSWAWQKNIFGTLKYPVCDLLIRPPKAVVYQAYSDGDTKDVLVQNKKVLRLQYTAESRFLSSLFGRSHKDVFCYIRKPGVLCGLYVLVCVSTNRWRRKTLYRVRPLFREKNGIRVRTRDCKGSLFLSLNPFQHYNVKNSNCMHTPLNNTPNK